MHVYRYGNAEADIVLIQLVGDHDISEIEDETVEIRKLTSMDFQLLAVKVDDWNKDLSPWKASAAFGNEDFGDGAAQTLEEVYVQIKVRLIILADIPFQGCFHYGRSARRPYFLVSRQHHRLSGFRDLQII